MFSGKVLAQLGERLPGLPCGLLPSQRGAVDVRVMRRWELQRGHRPSTFDLVPGLLHWDILGNLLKRFVRLLWRWLLPAK